MKKVLSLTLAFALVLAIGIGGTLAWLTDQTDPIVNTFTIGKIQIDLTEGDELDLKAIPGKEIYKDPTVTVEPGSEACYVFVKIEEGGNFGDFFSYDIAEGWNPLNDGSNVYYRENDYIDANGEPASYPVLKDNKVVTDEDIEGFDNYNPTLTITAYAIQQHGFGDADKAWDALWDQITPPTT